jgi:hypothetical protein
MGNAIVSLTVDLTARKTNYTTQANLGKGRDIEVMLGVAMRQSRNRIQV